MQCFKPHGWKRLHWRLKTESWKELKRAEWIVTAQSTQMAKMPLLQHDYQFIFMVDSYQYTWITWMLSSYIGAYSHLPYCTSDPASPASFTRMSFRWWNATLAARPEILLFNPINIVNAAWDCRDCALCFSYFFIQILKVFSQHAHVIHAAHVTLESDSHAGLVTGLLAAVTRCGKWFVFVQALEIARTCRDMLGGRPQTVTVVTLHCTPMYTIFGPWPMWYTHRMPESHT